jgi:hypothetical protein
VPALQGRYSRPPKASQNNTD